MTRAHDNYSMMLTPPGTGAVAVLRVAGPDALGIVAGVFRSKRAASLRDASPGQVRYGQLMDGSEAIDNVLVVVVTRGDTSVVEICPHGGVRIVERVLEVLDRAGAPLAHSARAAASCWPASSTIDREALEALSRAKTERAVRFLAWQRRHLIPALAEVAHKCALQHERAGEILRSIRGRYHGARALLEGATVAIVGPPNSGKSTLFNRLVGRASTVVSPLPGTTRDWVSASIELAGVPVTLVDTAGQGAFASDLEEQAIRSGRAASAGADLCLFVLDGAQPFSEKSLNRLPAKKDTACLVIINKLDKPQRWDRAALPPDLVDLAVAVSAETGAGVDKLTDCLIAQLGCDSRIEALPCLFTERQVRVVDEVLSDFSRNPSTAENLIRMKMIGLSGDDSKR